MIHRLISSWWPKVAEAVNAHRPVAIAGIIFALVLGAISLTVSGRPEVNQQVEAVQSIIDATMNPRREQRLEAIAQIATKIEGEVGFPAEVMLAQWAIESDWGEHPACKQNYFGVKKASRHKLSCSEKTTEVVDGRAGMQLPQQFADYQSLEESSRDYATMIMTAPRYSRAWESYRESKDPEKLLVALGSIYWTGKGYAAKAVSIMKRPEVTSALAAARGLDLPSAPPAPRGLPQSTVVSISIALGNGIIGFVGWAWRQQSRARHEEFRRRLDGLRSSVEVKLAEADSGLQGRIEETLDTALKAHTLNLMDRFNGRYLQTTRFDKAHDEMMNEIRAIKGRAA